ncbi:MAG: hypothetical protein AAF490_29520, partial [Chloroflexota bacterium]
MTGKFGAPSSSPRHRYTLQKIFGGLLDDFYQKILNIHQAPKISNIAHSSKNLFLCSTLKNHCGRFFTDHNRWCIGITRGY